MKVLSYVIPSPEEFKSYFYTDSERYVLESWNEKMIYGSANQVVKKLNDSQRVSGVNELMINNLGYFLEGMLHSAKLIADANNMPHVEFEG